MNLVITDKSGSPSYLNASNAFFFISYRYNTLSAKKEFQHINACCMPPLTLVIVIVFVFVFILVFVFVCVMIWSKEWLSVYQSLRASCDTWTRWNAEMPMRRVCGLVEGRWRNVSNLKKYSLCICIQYALASIKVNAMVVVLSFG